MATLKSSPCEALFRITEVIFFDSIPSLNSSRPLNLEKSLLIRTPFTRMLGRLFNGATSPGEGQYPLEPPIVGHQYREDSYARKLLYGISDTENREESKTNFSILVIEEQGLRRDKVLFESNRGRKSFISDLGNYAFGCGVPINEGFDSVKLHLLPSDCVMISRVFPVGKSFQRGRQKCSHCDWNTKPVICHDPGARDSKVVRLAICVVISLNGNNLQQVVCDNWHELGNFVYEMQKSCIEKLHKMCVDKMDFPVFALQDDADLSQYPAKLVRLMSFLTRTPRILLGYATCNDYALLNWCHAIALWLEFKDGRGHQSTRFLSSLFSVLLPLRESLLHKPADKSQPITRVVVMSGNPMVSQKLMVILSGIFHNDTLFEDLAPREKKKEERPEMNSWPSQSTTTTLKKSGWAIPQAKSVAVTGGSPAKSSFGVRVQSQSSSYSSLQNLSSSFHGGFLDRLRSDASLKLTSPTPSASSAEMDEFPFPHYFTSSTQTYNTLGGSGYKLERLPKIRRKASYVEINDERVTSHFSREEKLHYSIEDGIVDVQDIPTSTKTTKRKPLLPLCGYIQQFVPQFALQVCPINLGLENKILCEMQNDCTDHNIQQPGQTVSTTIFISLRAKEVKLLRVKSGSTRPTSEVIYAPYRRLQNLDKKYVDSVTRILEEIAEEINKLISANNSQSSKGLLEVESKTISKTKVLTQKLLGEQMSVE